jgi:hypothetical protein
MLRHEVVPSFLVGEQALNSLFMDKHYPKGVDGELQANLARAAGSNGSLARSAAFNPESPVVRFYQMVGSRPVWVDEDGLRPQGEALLAAIGKASADGLEPDLYLLPALRAAWENAVAFPDRIHLKNPQQCILLDESLTEAMLRYAQHLSLGRVMPQTFHGNGWPGPANQPEILRRSWLRRCTTIG